MPTPTPSTRQSSSHSLPAALLLLSLALTVAIFNAHAQILPDTPPGMAPQPVNNGYLSPVPKSGELIAQVTQNAINIARIHAQRITKSRVPSIAAQRRELAKMLGVRNSTAITNTTVLLKGAASTRVDSPKLRLAQRKGWVRGVERNFKMFAFQSPPAAPNDTFFRLALMWGLSNQAIIGGVANVDIDAPEAWLTTEGSPDLVVAVLDTGVTPQHPDLLSRLWVNPREIPNNQLDDDKNGYIDDVQGWDFVDKDNVASDAHMHGTHVAGTIVAEKNNSRGVVGVAPGAKVISLKVLNSKGEGSSAEVMAGIQYAIDLRKAGVNLRVINVSLGGGETSDSFRELLEEANRVGILIVAAAGNEASNNDEVPIYPANYDLPNVISVAAIDNRGLLASFSNFGIETVDLAAPGVFIWSTFPMGFYFFLDGTSMAAPHVSGVAALLFSKRPDLTPSEVIGVLRASVKPLASLEGKMRAPGVLSAAKALELVRLK